MKAAVLTAPGKIEIQDVKKPEIKGNELLVKLKFCGICTLEQRLYSGSRKMFYPLIMGHEAAGEVVEVGKDVLSDITPGTRVALDLIIRCHACYYCRVGMSNRCLNRSLSNKVLGGFGEYIAIHYAQAFPIPDSLSYEEAAFAEPVACCIHSLKKINFTMAEDLLIIGAGPMGLLHLQVALCMGGRVFISEPDERRRKMAEKMGAFLTIDPDRENVSEVLKKHTEGRGADACIITSPAPGVLDMGIRSIGKGGRINIYTSYNNKPSIPVDANKLHHDELILSGSEGRTELDFQQAVRLLSFGKINVKPLISKLTSFSTIDSGMNSALSEDTYRVLLDLEAE